MVAGDTAGPLETLVNDGWNYHDTDSERLARELEAAAADAVVSDLLTTFLHLSIHTIREHLGEWGRALRLGKRALEGQTPTAETARAWGRPWPPWAMTTVRHARLAMPTLQHRS